ncbi:glycosyltransferase family 4 protein [Sphaerisporangium aureirubrum]|uniref:Glycosyltransferase family 4 protein n=1 Tax=Sphaerisporangium aureirubrum TaxID=1544736 RepID=A0ABW1NSU9_9ACTN
MTMAVESRPRLVYVIPHLSEHESEHFAHIPALLAELGKRVEVAAVVERGAPPERLDGVRLLVRVGGTGRITRVLGTLSAVRRCAAAGHDTYFLRYSRLFLAVLIVTRPLYRHRILLWRSGISDVAPPEVGRTPARVLNDLVNWTLLRFVHRFVTGPESMVGYMSRRWRVPPGKMALLYNDVDATRFAPLPADHRRKARADLGWAEDEFVILFVHRLSYRKGARLLGPVFRRLVARVDVPVRLVVVGDGPDRPDVEQAARAPELRGRMLVVGALPNHELPRMYAAADCLLMPSLEEGFPRVIVEAMAAALPVVCTDAGGSGDVIGPDHPYISRVGDTAALLRHLEAVIALPAAERAALGDRLRARAGEQFSPARVAAMLQGLL